MSKEPSVEILEAKQKNKRSAVRICVTYGAGAYVVLGGAMLMATALFGGETGKEMFGEAKDVFLATLPIATGILTYWFADRSATKNRDEARTTPPKPPQDNEDQGE